MNIRELRKKRAQLIAQARSLLDAPGKETRAMTPEEQTEYDELLKQIKGLDESLEREERQAELETSLQSPPNTPRSQAPSFNRLPLGDSEVRALGHYIKTGDTGGVRSLMESEEGQAPEIRVHMPTGLEMRATAEVMNVAADADGKSAVPTGFVSQIAARRAEVRLAERLGVQMIPGQGTTVNYPYENADAVVFGATSEQVDNLSNTYEQDRPTLATKAFTLAKKTKKLILTEELLDDEDANLMAFIADHIGRAMGLTHNTLLMTEAAATGTSVALGAAAAATAGDPEKLVFHATLGFYLDDGASAAWVMRPPTYGAILNLTGNARLYAPTAAGTFNRDLFGYPVYYSNAAAAIAASAKSIYFGNWRYMGMREDPALRLIRDPYTTDGVVILKYSFRVVYGLLIAGALAYGAHPSA